MSRGVARRQGLCFRYALLKTYDLGLIAVGGHDSSDAVIELVKEEFGPAHRYVRVG